MKVIELVDILKKESGEYPVTANIYLLVDTRSNLKKTEGCQVKFFNDCITFGHTEIILQDLKLFNSDYVTVMPDSTVIAHFGELETIIEFCVNRPQIIQIPMTLEDMVGVKSFDMDYPIDETTNPL